MTTALLLERLQAFVAVRERMKGTDPEIITVSDGVPLTMSDLRAAISAIRAAVGGEAIKPLVRFRHGDPVTGKPILAPPPATVDVGALADRVGDLLHRIEGFGKAYPTDMFSEVTADEREWLHATRPGLMDRIAASMGRHVSEKIAEDLASIRNELAALIGKKA